MESIEARANARTLRAWVALDTFDAIADRVTGLARSGRRITLVHRYLDTETRVPTVTTGLTLDTDLRDGGIVRRRQTNPENASIQVLLRPGIHSFSLAADPDDGTEEQQIKRWHAGNRKDLTLVEITGTGAERGQADRIEVTSYNRFGVGQQTVVAFDLLPAKDEADRDAALLDLLAAETTRRGTPLTAADLTQIAETMRYTWDPLAEILADPTRITP